MRGTTNNHRIQTLRPSESQTLPRNPIRYAPQPVNHPQAPSGTTIIMQRERDAISGSQIVTHTPTPERDANEASGSGEAAANGVEPPVLRLRLMGGDINRPRVAWDEKVVDNEFLGRKKSKSTSHSFMRELNADYAKFPKSAASTTNQKRSANHLPHRPLRPLRIPTRTVPLQGPVIPRMIG
jgi:hypothetical protein